MMMYPYTRNVGKCSSSPGSLLNGRQRESENVELVTVKTKAYNHFIHLVKYIFSIFILHFAKVFPLSMDFELSIVKVFPKETDSGKSNALHCTGSVHN